MHNSKAFTAGLTAADAPIPAPSTAAGTDNSQIAPSQQPVTPDLSLEQQVSHGAELRGLLSLPEKSQPVKVLADTPAQAKEAKPQLLSAPHRGNGQHPKPERRNLVQRALFKDIDREPEIQPVPDPRLPAHVRPGTTEGMKQASKTHAELLSTPATGPATAVAVGEKDTTSLGMSEAAEEEPVHPLVKHISPHKPARKWRSHSLEYESKLQKNSGRRYHSLPKEAARSYLQSLVEGATAQEKPPLKPEVLPRTADLPEADPRSRVGSKHPALALQAAGSLDAGQKIERLPALHQMPEVEVTFEEGPATGSRNRRQLQGLPESLASSPRAAVTYEAPSSAESSGLEKRGASMRPGWPFSPPKPRSRLGTQFLEVGKYEGQIKGSNVDGLGVLSKEGGGSYAGQVSSHQPT